jgi:hypothetical protein
MTYDLSAVVAGASLIKEMTGCFQHAAQVPLGEGLALIPAGGRWLDEIGWSVDERQYPPFEYLTGWLADFLRLASLRGPVAYLEIDEQQDRTFEAAVAWSGGELALRPRVVWPGDRQSAGGGPVAEAFRILGMSAEPGRILGVQPFRHTTQWLEVPGLVQRLAELDLVWRQPEEALAGFDFDTDYKTEAGGHLFGLRAVAAPDGPCCTVTFWGRTVLQLERLPGGWCLQRRSHG